MLRRGLATEAGSRRRVALTFVDQGVSSVSNFATGVAVARLSGAAQFGEYALVVMIWLVVLGVERRVIAEPMIVASRATDATSTPIAQGLSAVLLLGGVASAVVAVGGLGAFAAGSHTGITMVALAIWLVPLMVQDYWRAIAYQRRRPDLALVNDVVFAFVQVVAIVVFAMAGWRSAGFMIAAWGTGALAGAVVGFIWFPTLGPLRHGGRLLRSLWPLGRWLLADFVTSFASQQAYIAFAALLLSKVSYGGFRAATSLLGPVMVVTQAFGNIGLPEAARRADVDDHTALRQYARRLTLATVACVAAYLLFLAVAARQVLTALYGTQFARYAPLAVLAAFQYVLMVTASGQGIALRVNGAISRLWPLRIVSAVLSLASLVLLVGLFGLNGAGWAGVATGVFDSLAIHFIYYARPSETGGAPAHGVALASVSTPPLPAPVATSDGFPT